MWQKMNAMQAAVPTAGEETSAQEEAEKPGPIYPLETIIVNLADSGGGRYLRVTMELALTNDEGAEEEITQHLPEIKDAMLTILPTKKFDQLTSVEGKNSLRDEIIVNLNTVLNKELITKIFFTEFVIQ
jgi:flagellar FliL protein